jgi:hypothetical protein
MKTFICRHCGSQCNTFYEARVERCLCGEWYDPQYPRRLAVVESWIDDELIKEAREILIREVKGKTGRPSMDPAVKKERYKAYNREYARKYREKHRDEFNRRRREAYKKISLGVRVVA